MFRAQNFGLLVLGVCVKATISRIWDRLGEHNLAGTTKRTVLNSVPDQETQEKGRYIYIHTHTHIYIYIYIAAKPSNVCT